MKITQITMQDRGGLLYKIQVDYYARQRWITMQDRGGLLCKIEVDYYARQLSKGSRGQCRSIIELQHWTMAYNTNYV